VKTLRGAFVALAGAPFLALAAWSALALWFDGPASRPAAGLVEASFLAAVGWPLARVRPLARALALALLPCVLVLAWWLLIRPRTTARGCIREGLPLPKAREALERVTPPAGRDKPTGS